MREFFYYLTALLVLAAGLGMLFVVWFHLEI